VNQSAIYCSISSHGEAGPLAEIPGSELTVQAQCNVYAGLGSSDEPPLRLGADQASMDCGVIAYQGVVAALIARQRLGRGQHVAVSALGTLMCIKGMHWSCLSNPDQWPGLHLSAWTDPPKIGNAAKDGPILYNLNARISQEPRLEDIDRLMAALGSAIPEGMDPIDRNAFGNPKHPSHLRWNPFWDDVFSRFTWRELTAIFEANGGQVLPFMDYAGLDHHPQIEALESFVDDVFDGRPIRVVRMPWRLDRAAISSSSEAAVSP
jgi:formyl-CoA transferase